LRNRKTREEIKNRLCISVSQTVFQRRFRRFGHEERKDADDWVSDGRNTAVSGERCRGKGRQSWKESLADDMRRCDMSLRQTDAQGRAV
jgi:hypothetical protein